MTWNKLIIQSMFFPAIRSSLTITVVFFCCTALFLYLTFAVGIELSLNREKQFLGADLLVVPRKSAFEPEEALMMGAFPNITMKDDILDILKKIKEIKRFTPQLYFRSLSPGCCSIKEYPLVGFDPESDFVIMPQAGGATRKSLGESSLLAGCDASSKVFGRKVVFFNRTFTIKSVLPCTGMAVDRTFFMPISVSRKIAARQFGFGKHDISSVLIKLKQQSQIDYVVEVIEYLAEDVRVLKVPLIIKQAYERIRLVERLVGFSLIILAITGAGMLFGICWLVYESRMRETALMLALGATRLQLIKMSVGEMLYLSLIGTFTGIGVGFICLYLFKKFLVEKIRTPFILPENTTIIVIAVLTMLVMLIITIISALIALFHLLKLEPDTALKNTRC